MKKRTLLITALLIFVLAAAGCGSTPASQDTSESKSQEVSSASAEEAGAEEAKGDTKEESKTAEAAQESSAASETKETAGFSMKDRAGTYHLTTMIMEGFETATGDLAILEELGMGMTLVLNEDGTGILNIGEETEITWDEKTITSEGEPMKYTYDPELQKITLTEEEAEMSFTIMTAAELIEAGLGTEGDGSQLAGLVDESEDADAVEYEMVGADWIGISETEEDRTEGLCIWYDLTNKSDDYMAMYYVTVRAEQDGRELEEGMIYPIDLIDGEEYRYSSIRPGVTCRAIHLLDADPKGGRIKYTVSAGYLNDSVIFETELDPKKLPGGPGEVFEPEKIEKIDWLDDVEESGVCSEEYEVTIKNSEIKIDDEKERYLRVWFEFTNNSEEDAAFYNACSYRAVQDGVSLNTGWSSYDDTALDAVYDDVAPGETAEVCVEWVLRDDSPVAVEVYDWWTEEIVLGKAFDVK